MESAQPPEGVVNRWTLYPCPECGDAARCRCGLEQCGHHGERAAVEVVPADQLAGAVEIIRALVAANDTHDGAIGEVRTAIGDERADQLRAILTGQ